MSRRKFELIFLALLTAISGCGGQGKHKDSDYVAYCPKCGDEVSYSPAILKASCGACGPTAPPRKKMLRGEDRSSGPWSAIVAWGVTIAVVVLGSVNGWVAYRRHRLEAAKRETAANLRCRCPGCKRKFAYSVEKAGASAVCPRCKKQFQLPHPPPQET